MPTSDSSSASSIEAIVTPSAQRALARPASTRSVGFLFSRAHVRLPDENNYFSDRALSDGVFCAS